jgi:hypothetical protein
MKTFEENKRIIETIDLAHTNEGILSQTVYVSVNKIQLRLNKNPYYTVNIFNISHTTDSFKFASPKKALDKFFELCMELNLCTSLNK